MPVKIRLGRHGKKGYAFYHIVVADSRAPRDGKFIEKIGTYNPNTNPATIDLNFEKALSWLQKGAQPTDTCRAILSEKGVLMRKHLLGGVAKGAFSESDAEAKFNKWLSEKEAKGAATVSKLAGDARAAEKVRMAAEAKANQEKAAAIAAKKAEAAGAAAGEEAAEEASEEAAAEAAEETIDVAAAAEVAAEAIEIAENAATPAEAEAAIEVAEAAVEAVVAAEEAIEAAAEEKAAE